jgi:hypothetical protein
MFLFHRSLALQIEVEIPISRILQTFEFQQSFSPLAPINQSITDKLAQKSLFYIVQQAFDFV